MLDALGMTSTLSPELVLQLLRRWAEGAKASGGIFTASVEQVGGVDEDKDLVAPCMPLAGQDVRSVIFLSLYLSGCVVLI